MSPEQENFESLRRLLALKRHEQPPPGYFNNFSSDVIARIRLERSGVAYDDSVEERILSEAPWLARIWQALESKPVFAGVFGAAVCGLLIAGVSYSERASSRPPVALLPGASEPVATGFDVQQRANNTLLAQPSLGGSLTAAPVAAPAGSLFEEFNRTRANGADPRFHTSLVSAPGAAN